MQKGYIIPIISHTSRIKATIVYRDELVTAFRDIHPAAPAHILIVPNKHIESVNTLGTKR